MNRIPKRVTATASKESNMINSQEKRISKPRNISLNQLSSAAASKAASNYKVEICLQANDYSRHLRAELSNFLDNGTLGDVTIYADGQSLKGHKLILASCSDYFAHVLNAVDSQQDPIIILNDVKFWQLKALMEFMYKGEVNIEISKMDALLKAGIELKIKGILALDYNYTVEQDTNNISVRIPKPNDITKPTSKTTSNKVDAVQCYNSYSKNKQMGTNQRLTKSKTPSNNIVAVKTYNRKKQTGMKQTRKKKQLFSPSNPSLVAQREMNLKGAKSRFREQQPEYPNLLALLPSMGFNPIFPTDNVILTPMEQSSAQVNLDNLVNETVANAQVQIVEQQLENNLKQKSETHAPAPIGNILYNYVCLKPVIITTPLPIINSKFDPAIPSTSKGVTDHVPAGKLVLVEDSNERDIVVIQRAPQHFADQYMKESKTVQAEQQVQIRNMLADTTYKLVSTSQFTSILKKAELGNPAGIVKDNAGNATVLLKPSNTSTVVSAELENPNTTIKEFGVLEGGIFDVETLEEDL